MVRSPGEDKLKSRTLFSLSVLMVVIIFVACQPSVEATQTTSQSQPTVISLVSPTTTSTAILTETPLPTAVITKTPYPSTPVSQQNPDITHGLLANGLLFSEDATCRLPCWYGLRVGQSNVEEIQNTFRQIFGLSESYIFTMGRDPDLSNDNSDYVRFDWKGGKNDTGELSLFGIQTYFNPKTSILGVFQMSTSVPSFLKTATPQKVIYELGIPSTIRVRLDGTGNPNIAGLQAIALFSQDSKAGVYLYWRTYFPVKDNVVTWCLDGATDQRDSSLDIRTPPSDDPRAIASIQNDYKPIDDVFGITPEDLYQRVIDGNNVCLSRKF
jgi:hypothetical protein